MYSQIFIKISVESQENLNLKGKATNLKFKNFSHPGPIHQINSPQFDAPRNFPETSKLIYNQLVCEVLE